MKPNKLAEAAQAALPLLVQTLSSIIESHTHPDSHQIEDPDIRDEVRLWRKVIRDLREAIRDNAWRANPTPKRRPVSPGRHHG